MTDFGDTFVTLIISSYTLWTFLLTHTSILHAPYPPTHTHTHTHTCFIPYKDCKEWL